MSEEIAAELGRLAWRIARRRVTWHGDNIIGAALVAVAEHMLRGKS